MTVANVFAGGGLDRAGHRRRDAEWLAAQLAHPATRFVPVWRSRSLVRQAAEGPAALMLAPEQVAPALAAAYPLALLGLEDGIAHFAVDLSAEEDPLARLPLEAGLEPAFQDLRMLGTLLGRRDAALLAYARGLMHWHSRHRFCGVCGHPAESAEGGHVRKCTNPACATSHFPRTDPAVIMLVSDGDRVLLGRQAAWPAGFQSVLAGFVEPGESLEEAVAREVLEESGIEVEDVVYQSSQPWPFPASIMLGFRARARTTEIRVDPHELEEAHWRSRDWIRAQLAAGSGFRLPPPSSIARRLVDEWLAEG